MACQFRAFFTYQFMDSAVTKNPETDCSYNVQINHVFFFFFSFSELKDVRETILKLQDGHHVVNEAQFSQILEEGFQKPNSMQIHRNGYSSASRK